MTDHWLYPILWAIPGSALGGLTRYLVSGWVSERCGERFPLGTLVVNVTGTFLIGVAAFFPWEEMMADGIAAALRLFLMAGFLGGYTTVSSFSLQTFLFLEMGDIRKAGLNIVLSAGLCLVAVGCGAWVAAGLGALIGGT